MLQLFTITVCRCVKQPQILLYAKTVQREIMNINNIESCLQCRKKKKK